MVPVISSLDWGTIGANVGAFLGAATALFIGIKSGLKKISKGEVTPESSRTQIAGATLIETTSLLMWSESNRDVVEALNRMTAVLTNVMDRVEIVDDLTKEAIELRHQIERLRDKL